MIYWGCFREVEDSFVGLTGIWSDLGVVLLNKVNCWNIFSQRLDFIKESFTFATCFSWY